MNTRLEEEMKLVCLFHNGKVAVVDLLAHLQANETIEIEVKERLQKLKTSVLAIYPRYIAQYPSELEKIRNNLQICITLLPVGSIELLDSITAVFALGDFVANAGSAIYDLFCSDIYDNEDYPDIINWVDFWTTNSSHIVKILTYLHENKAIDDRIYFQKTIEVETVLLSESKYMLYKVYPEPLQNHYGSSANFEDDRRYGEEWRFLLLNFDVQFNIRELNSKPCPSSGPFYSLNCKRKLSSSDIALDCPLSDRIDQSMRNIFLDKFGDLVSERCHVSMCGVSMQEVDIDGRQAGYPPTYKLKIVHNNGQPIQECYQSSFSPESRKFKEKLKCCFKEIIFISLNQKVHFGLNSWYPEHTYIESTSYIEKTNHRKWKLKELYALDKPILEATNKFNMECTDLKVSLMRPYYTVPTRNLHYLFQLFLHSPGLLEAVEETICFAQEAFMDIESF